jgi:hypothetical protein
MLEQVYYGNDGSLHKPPDLPYSQNGRIGQICSHCSVFTMIRLFLP